MSTVVGSEAFGAGGDQLMETQCRINLKWFCRGLQQQVWRKKEVTQQNSEMFSGHRIFSLIFE